jgi:hypothetical protein
MDISGKILCKTRNSINESEYMYMYITPRHIYHNVE